MIVETWESSSNTATLEELANPPVEAPSTEERLAAFFVRLAISLGLPRSVGQIYGTLFCASGPLAFEELTHGSGVSKGAVSQGVRTLEGLRAIRSITRPNDRRTFFEAEASMKRLVSNFLRESVQPFLEEGEEELQAIADNLDGHAASSGSHGGSARPDLAAKVNSLLRWHAEIRKFLPLVATLAAPTSDL